MIGLILNRGAILSINHRFKNDNILRWAKSITSIELFGWIYIPYQVTKAYDYVIIIASTLKHKFNEYIGRHHNKLRYSSKVDKNFQKF